MRTFTGHSQTSDKIYRMEFGKCQLDSELRQLAGIEKPTGMQICIVVCGHMQIHGSHSDSCLAVHNEVLQLLA